MKTYSFNAKISKDSDIFSGKTYNPKGFYYQGKNKQYIILVGDTETNDSARVKLLTEDVKITISEDQ